MSVNKAVSQNTNSVPNTNGKSRSSIMNRIAGIATAVASLGILAGTVSAPTSEAAVIAGTIINYDIGASGGSAGGPLSQSSYSSVDFDSDGSDDVWNELGNPATLGSGTDLSGSQDIDGNAVSGLTIAFENVSGQASGFPNTVDAWDESYAVPDGVVDSIYWQTSGSSVPMTFTIKGAGGVDWDVEVFTMVHTDDSPTDQAYDIQVNGLFANGSSTSATRLEGDDFRRHTEGAVGQNRVRFEGISADGNGWLTVTLSGTNETVNALRLVAIPEPTTLALLGLGVVTLLGRRRRQARQ